MHPQGNDPFLSHSVFLHLFTLFGEENDPSSSYLTAPAPNSKLTEVWGSLSIAFKGLWGSERLL